MSYLIPGWNVSIENKKQFRRAASDALVQRSIQLGIATSEHDVVHLGLFPKHIGLSKWVVPEHREGEWFEWSSYEIGRHCIAILSVSIVFPFTPGISLLKFQAGVTRSTTMALFSLSSLYSIGPVLKTLEEDISIQRIANNDLNLQWLNDWPKMEGYFSEPIIYDAGATFTASLFCDSTDKLGLVLDGFVLEKIGQSVSQK